MNLEIGGRPASRTSNTWICEFEVASPFKKLQFRIGEHRALEKDWVFSSSTQTGSKDDRVFKTRLNT